MEPLASIHQIPEHKREQVLDALKLYNEACMAVAGNAND